MPFIEELDGEQVAYKGSKAVAKDLRMALELYLFTELKKTKNLLILH